MIFKANAFFVQQRCSSIVNLVYNQPGQTNYYHVQANADNDVILENSEKKLTAVLKCLRRVYTISRWGNSY